MGEGAFHPRNESPIPSPGEKAAPMPQEELPFSGGQSIIAEAVKIAIKKELL